MARYRISVLWKDRTDIGDSVEWQRRERASWTRPWDDDYDDVKAEFPDLFDEEDDRQRQIYLDMLKAQIMPQRSVEKSIWRAVSELALSIAKSCCDRCACRLVVQRARVERTRAMRRSRLG